MRNGWTEVPLGEVISPRREVPTDEELLNNAVRVISKIKFATGRMEYRNSGETRTGMIRIRPGDLVVSGINAAKGAIAIYPEDAVEDAAATIHYGAYTVDPRKADKKFLWWLMRSAAFRDILDVHLPKGIKTELKAKRLLPIPVPLPPLSEQKRIAGHLDAIGHRLNRIQKTREEAQKELLAALRSAFHNIEADAEWVEMGEVAPLVRREIAVEPDGSYPELGIRSFGRGTFHKPAVLGVETTKRLFEIHEGDLVFNNVFAWEGAIAVAKKEDHGRVGSHRFITCVCDFSRILPEVLHFYFLTKEGLEKIGQASPGGAGRNRTLGIKKLGKISVPIPSIQKQNEFLNLLRLREEIERQQAKTIVRQNALLPSLLDRIFNQRE